jgi:ribonucleoside-diphosphate reductase alpha chain
MGMTTNADIPFAKSLVDYIFRWLGMHFIPGYRELNAPRRGGAYPETAASVTAAGCSTSSLSSPAMEAPRSSASAHHSSQQEVTGCATDSQIGQTAGQTAGQKGPAGSSPINTAWSLRRQVSLDTAAANRGDTAETIGTGVSEPQSRERAIAADGSTLNHPTLSERFTRTETGSSVTTSVSPTQFGATVVKESSVSIGRTTTFVVSALDQSNAALMGDAPACDGCGSITVRNGTCYRCLNCGNSMGCS